MLGTNENNATYIELKFTQSGFTGNYYSISYRKKGSFNTSTIIGRIKQFLFNNIICRWKTIYYFDYPLEHQKWIYQRSPNTHWRELLIQCSSINHALEKFSTLETIENYIQEQKKRFNFMKKEYERQSYLRTNYYGW